MRVQPGDIDKYWPDWKDQLRQRMGMMDMIASCKMAPDTEGVLRAILDNQKVILTALFWILGHSDASYVELREMGIAMEPANPTEDTQWLT